MRGKQHPGPRKVPHRDAVRAIRSHWLVVLIVAAPIVAATAVYVGRLPNEYRAVAVVGMVPRAGAQFPGADYVPLDAARYITYATAPLTLESIARSAGALPTGDTTDLQQSVDVALVTGTSNISVAVKESSPIAAARMANAIADAIVRYSGSDALLEATLVTPAAHPTQPAAPLRRLDLAAGIAAGILAGIAVAVIVDLRNPRITHWRDIAQLVDLPVLGLIPRSAVREDGDVEPGSAPVTSVARTVSAILLRNGSGVQHVVAVMSVSAAKGKTAITRAIVSEMEASGRRTLLIEADPPTKRKDAHDGLAAERDGTEPLLIVHAAISIEQPLAGNVPTGNEAFDFVIMDVPPLSDGEGSALIAQSDQVVMIVDRGASVHDMNDSLDLLEAMKANVVGFVGKGLD